MTIEMTPEDRARYGNTARRKIGNAEYEFDNGRVSPIQPRTATQVPDAYQRKVHQSRHLVFDYLCKYLTKGDPLLAVRIEQSGGREGRVLDYDEFQHHFNANYRTSMQAMARLLGLRVFDMSHTVKMLRVHMPGEG